MKLALRTALWAFALTFMGLGGVAWFGIAFDNLNQPDTLAVLVGLLMLVIGLSTALGILAFFFCGQGGES